MSLLIALIVENSNILATIYFVFLKKRARPNLESFQYQIWKRSISEKIGKVVIK